MQYTSHRCPAPTVRLHQVHQAAQLPPLPSLDAASVRPQSLCIAICQIKPSLHFHFRFAKDSGGPRGKAMPTEAHHSTAGGRRARPRPREGFVRPAARPCPPHPTPGPTPTVRGRAARSPAPPVGSPVVKARFPHLAGAHLQRPSRRQLLQQLQHFRPSPRRPPATSPRPATPRVRACTQAKARLSAHKSAGSRPCPARLLRLLALGVCLTECAGGDRASTFLP